jgi:hypothetical protein
MSNFSFLAVILVSLSMILLLPTSINSAAAVSSNSLGSSPAGSTNLSNGTMFIELSRVALARFLNSLMPIQMAVPGASTGSGILSIRDVRYCKPTSRYAATLLGFGQVSPSRPQPNSAKVVTDSAVFSDADCTGDLKAIEARIPRANGSIVAKLALDWEPWKLKIKVEQLAGDGSQDLSKWTGAQGIVPTDSIPILIGDKQVPFNGAIAFSGYSLSVLLLPTENIQNTVGLSDISWPAQGMSNWTHSADVRLEISLTALNYLASNYLGGDQKVIAPDVPVVGRISLKNLTVSGPSDNQLLISGTLFDGNNNSYKTKILLKGADLSVSSVDIQPQSQDFLLRTVAATISGALSSDPPTGYRGILIRKLVKPDTIHLKTDTASADIQIVISSVNSSSGSLRVGAWVIFGSPASVSY